MSPDIRNSSDAEGGRVHLLYTHCAAQSVDLTGAKWFSGAMELMLHGHTARRHDCGGVGAAEIAYIGTALFLVSSTQVTYRHGCTVILLLFSTS